VDALAHPKLPFWHVDTAILAYWLFRLFISKWFQWQEEIPVLFPETEESPHRIAAYEMAVGIIVVGTAVVARVIPEWHGSCDPHRVRCSH
jgi:hypothetical protein